ncbi:Exocyst complex component 5 [Homalodisca vitripennis]|nr:Exocyst complex component 5 [Homalodisca vitripennis]
MSRQRLNDTDLWPQVDRNHLVWKARLLRLVRTWNFEKDTCKTDRDLQLLLERQQKKCEKLEQACHDEEANHWQDISKLQEKNKSTVSLFQELDERINFVATKVIHLGDQLESVNTPRSRAVQAQKLMNHFAEFLSPGPVMAEFTQNNLNFQIDEAADVIQKLHLIAQELPPGKFEEAKKKIAVKYDEIERALIEEFVEAHRKYDVNRMQEIAAILSHFKGYTQCVDAFIEHSQSNTFGGKDVFSDVIPMCEKNFNLMSQVFNNPEQVMGKFVLNIYHFKLQKYIVGKLSDKSDADKYLKNLMDLYSRTVQLSKELSRYNMGTDDTYLSTLTRNIFQKYFDSYISKRKHTTITLKDKLDALCAVTQESMECEEEVTMRTCVIKKSWYHTKMVQQRLTLPYTDISRATTGYCYTCQYHVDDTMMKLCVTQYTIFSVTKDSY